MLHGINPNGFSFRSFTILFSFQLCLIGLVLGAVRKAETLRENGNDASALFKDRFAKFGEFDTDHDERLNPEEFLDLCKLLFQDEKGKSYPIDKKTLEPAFKLFDFDGNGYIDMGEYSICYYEWITKILSPVSVLVIVDVQYDFINGSLALKDAPAKQDGAAVVGPINKMLDKIAFHEVVYTHDWHPSNHISFVDNVQLRKFHKTSKIKDPSSAKALDTVIFEARDGHPIEQTLWPIHAIQHSPGSSLHHSLKVIPGGKKVYKGTDPDMDSYSAFLDNEKKKPSTDLIRLVNAIGATDVYVCGLAIDFCAGATALDSLMLGYRTVFVEDASRGVSPDAIKKRKEDLRKNGGIIVNTSKVENMVKGLDRRVELGLFLAQRLEKKRHL